MQTLEASVVHNNISVPNYLHCFSSKLVTAHFLHKYRNFIKTIDVNSKGDMSIAFKDGFAFKNTRSYVDLAQNYDTAYYLSDCGGFDLFNKSNGIILDPRLSSVATLIGDISNKRILDIGCGRGEFANYCYEKGAEVVGVDYANDAINIARSTFQTCENLKFICTDIMTMDEDEKFDVVVMSDVIEHIEQESLEQLFLKITQLLGNEGYLIIHTAPNKNYLEIHYHNKVMALRSEGVYLPLNPRSYYEELMHINEQSPYALRESLQKFFAYVNVWTSENTTRACSHYRITK